VGYVIGLLFDAAIIGIIVAVMEEGDFPGWGPMIGCALAIGVAAGGTSALLPAALWPVAVLVGALVGALVISWLCGMTFRRAAKAAGIYLGVRFVLTLLLHLLVSA
jgi:hypothetical protein